MANIQDQIGKIDTSKPEGMAQLMILQMRMQQLQQTDPDDQRDAEGHARHVDEHHP
jgi:hypothetical protein